jgi:hypothetical protein
MDRTVSRVGQSYSFPNTLAGQFALVGGGAFTQPSYAEDVDNLGGFSFAPGSTRLIINTAPKLDSFGNIILDANGNPVPQGPQPINKPSTITLTPQATAYNNMGVPGAKSFHLLAPGYGNVANLPNANPYFIRHATSTTATVLGDAMLKSPTFFTNWIGGNDILSYATSGGVGVNQTGNINFASYGINDITDPGVFASVYSTIITTLTSGGAKGVVATIPSVTSIPYFTTVPYNALPAEATATNINALQLYGFLAQVTGGRISPLSTVPGTRNPVLITDETLTSLSSQITGAAAGVPSLAPFASALGQLYGKARQATSNDLILLPASGKIGNPNSMGIAPFNVNGVTFPLQDEDVLIPFEKSAIATATFAYNASITSIAASNGLAVANMNAILGQLVSGLKVEDGTIYTANYFSSATASTVLFSLDGVHPNARGYAVITNEIIKVINSYYNANIPFVSAAGFPGATILTSNN